jgi:hypothetical protein
MPHTTLPWTIVPYGADKTLYIVSDRSERAGEILLEEEDAEAVISRLISGQFNDPARVIAFNTLEHWVKDMSAEIAFEIQTRFDMDCADLPDHIKDFVESHTSSCPQK